MIPEYIIIHHSLTKDSKTLSWPIIRRFHMGNKRRFRDIGYHYGVEKVKDRIEVLVGRLMNETGAHCIPDHMNYKSLGICVVGNFNETPPDVAIWDKTILLVASLAQLLHIPADKIKGHREVDLNRTCPGKYWNMDVFRSVVRTHLNGKT